MSTELETSTESAQSAVRDGLGRSWVSVSDRLPNKTGKYQCKTIEGSINPKEHERTLLGRMYQYGFRFHSGDWTIVTHWLDVEA